MAIAPCPSITFTLTPDALTTLLDSVLNELLLQVHQNTHVLSPQLTADLLEGAPDDIPSFNLAHISSPSGAPNTQQARPIPVQACSAPPHLISGYPQRPLINEVARALCVWAQTGTYPIYLPSLHLLQEAAQVDSGALDAAGCLLAELRACEEEAAARQLLKGILEVLGEWGLLSFLRLRHTVGSLPRCPPPVSSLCDSFNQRHKPNTAALLTVGARALAKHCQRDCTSAWWGVSTGSEQQKNTHAEGVLYRIFEDAVWINIHTLPHQVHVLEIRTSLGYGARWSADGKTFRGFLEPQQEDGHAVGWRH
eukprot:comp18490_c0_seq1/m.19862 comp18490_c0_seq1/g.19862  ORF comp18490_c0_seq1/g.19862 comp18490_c0_seq1/m.19862 type:complete len:309 (-) comp18490_c0_seq1:261-1187(-)